MKRILITGFSGFVSRHFLTYLDEQGIASEVLGVSRSAPSFSLDKFRHIRCRFHQLDLLDRTAVGVVVGEFRPTHILHLAAYSSVGFSWQKPVESFNNNTNVFLNLLEQVRSINLPCRVLSVGSSEEYGDVAPEAVPLREDAELRPLNPYAVARVAQEMLSRVYVRGYGLDVVMTRSFNHIGPYQRDVFVVPSFAKQLVAIRHRGAPARLVTGDRTVIRDFVDVRDVVRAYYGLLLEGQTGHIYNVCSGQGVSIDGVIDIMQDLLGTDVALETDPGLMRPSDNRIIIGSRDKIQAATRWEPKISLRDSLRSILDWWQQQT